jgi:RND superfamily putative drug exporter
MSELGDPGFLARLVSGPRSKWVVIVVWLALGGGFGSLAGGLGDAQANDAAAWLPTESESAQAIDRSALFFDPDNTDANVVIERTDGPLTEVDREAVAQLAATLQGEDHVVGTPIVEESTSGPALLVHVTMNPGKGGWETLREVAADIRTLGGELPEGLRLYVAGPAGAAADQSEAFSGVDGVLLATAVAVVVLLLLLTYRSPILWMLPLFSVGVALTIAMGVVYLLATRADVTVNAQTYSILPILVLGAGTDYALLLIARYRDELRRHEDKHTAMAVALHRAGPAIFASAATVVVALLCLLAADMSSTAGLGPVSAVGVAIAMLAILSLLPAVLLAGGRRVFWPVRPSYGTVDHTAEGMWARVGAGVARAPRLVWVGTTVVLLACSTASFSLDAEGLSSADSFTNEPESVKGDEIVSRYFDAGSGAPVFVISKSNQAPSVTQAVAATEGIDPDSVLPVGEPTDGYVLLAANLLDQADSTAARETIERVRAAVHAVSEADAVVGGQTAVWLDMKDTATRDNKVVIPLVLAVVLLILCVLLRAIVAPVLLLLTVVLSYGAAVGVSALIFEQLLGFEGTAASWPLFVFVFLVALGIDYNIFLMTRVREESTRLGTRQGALVGLRATGGVITSAGLVLAGTFAALGTLPLVFAVEMGIAVALGVLIDTFVVRSVLVTALTLDVGRAMWWPGTLWHQRDGDRSTERAPVAALPAVGRDDLRPPGPPTPRARG